MPRTAKLFTNGRSQAVRLPAEFRFEGKEVFIRRDPKTGDVILSKQPVDWSGFLDALAECPLPEDFLNEKERATGPHDRDPFAWLDEE